MSNAKHLELVEKQLYQRFTQISSELKVISGGENEDLVRELVDERRQVLEGLESYKFEESKESYNRELTGVNEASVTARRGPRGCPACPQRS